MLFRSQAKRYKTIRGGYTQLIEVRLGLVRSLLRMLEQLSRLLLIGSGRELSTNFAVTLVTRLEALEKRASTFSQRSQLNLLKNGRLRLLENSTKAFPASLAIL
jgi:hypothetical protein